MAKTIYEALSEQHDDAKAILERLADTSEEDAQTRSDLGSEVVVALISHNNAESKILYQRLLELEGMREQVEEHQDEHEEANEKLEALLGMDVDDPDWLDRLLEIKQAVEEHIEDEEEKLFPEAKEYLDQREAEELAALFEDEQSRRKQFLKAS